ncbi:MAG: 3-isopropylmalate dehydrogenase [Candidatus Dadabacteria bacterium]|nr:MAG: 3-isopropylmalate dehydrogenase [Candidatus Dadabacteria bacterium]
MEVLQTSPLTTWVRRPTLSNVTATRSFCHPLPPVRRAGAGAAPWPWQAEARWSKQWFGISFAARRPLSEPLQALFGSGWSGKPVCPAEAPLKHVRRSNPLYKIAVIPGDGTGPEVTREAVKVLEAAAHACGISYETVEFDFGGERYKRTGETLPDSAVEELRSFDAILLGAIGHPDDTPGILEKGILLKMRFELDLYINLRPVKLYPGVETPLKDKGPEDIDFVVVRENTEGLYTGSGGFLRKGTPHEVAIQESINTRMGVERCLRYAFDLARKRNRKKTLTLCGKTNVLTYAFDLWERAFHEIGEAEYPDVKREYAHVDATCMWMVKNPEWFDVIVTDNMFGDIITDLGAIIQGGMGIAAGGNIHPGRVSMFEPIGGSAPKYTGQGVINPMAAIGACQMMLAHLGENEAAERVERAMVYVMSQKLKSMSAGKMGYSTSEVGDLVADAVVNPR